MFAVGREVDLDDEARDVLTVADPVEGGSQRQVVEVHSTFNRTHRQEPVVWTEPGPGEQVVFETEVRDTSHDTGGCHT